VRVIYEETLSRRLTREGFQYLQLPIWDDDLLLYTLACTRTFRVRDRHAFYVDGSPVRKMKLRARSEQSRATSRSDITAVQVSNRDAQSYECSIDGTAAVLDVFASQVMSHVALRSCKVSYSSLGNFISTMPSYSV
jgi:hypothetical protein